MIVLDEQLLGRHIEQALKQWYRGAVVYITELRPNSVIKDDAIPLLLRQQRQPTFVTINERDFWQKVTIDHRFCVACFALSDSRVPEIPLRLKRLFRTTPFRTKSRRMGHVMRVTTAGVSFYSYNAPEVRFFPF
jgi:hypothetical protein